jgi:type VI secretion system protein ImpF
MPELIHKERLQPSLLDRLTDDDRDRPERARERNVLSLSQIRESVRRDLGWLFNSVHLDALVDLSHLPHVARSVLNFGIPDLAGHTHSSIDVAALEQLLRQAIWDFEPRLIRNTVKVRVVVDETMARHNSLQFIIEAELWAQPLPLPLLLKTQIDLEDGNVVIADARRQD